MSTYLIGIFITDFQCKSDSANAGVNQSLVLKACARLTAFNKLDYPLKASVRSIEYLQRLLGIPYPLPKLGMSHDIIVRLEFPSK
jgi:aminopeptidase N